MSLIHQQIAREEEAVKRGIERFYTVLEEDRAKGREFEGPVGQTLMRNTMRAFVPVVKDLQRDGRARLVEGMTTGMRLMGWEMPINAMSPEEIAYITIKTVLTNEPKQASRQIVGRRIGNYINLQARWNELRQAECDRLKEDEPTPGYNRLVYLQRTVKALNPKSLRGWLKKLDDVTTTEWGNEAKVKLGALLVEHLVLAAPETFEIQKSKSANRGQFRIKYRLALTAEARAILEDNYVEYAEDNPWLETTIAPPLDWTWSETEGRHVGGYYRYPSPLVKRSPMDHTHTIVDETLPQAVLDAVNRAQRTPWMINEPVLRLAEYAREHSINAVLPVEARRDMPAEYPDEVWATMSKTAQGKVRNERRQIHDHNNRLDAKRWAMRRQLVVANQNLDGHFYFPHNLDFRGRMYPIPQDLHPQADDFGRALLTFAEPKPLGPDGLQWLVFHLANCYGLDKASRGEQMDWYNDHNQEVYLVASDPFGEGLEFWLGADEKHRWQFLAAAIEVCAAWAHPVSHPATGCNICPRWAEIQ
jgi:DNA-directed RNA polymerase